MARGTEEREGEKKDAFATVSRTFIHKHDLFLQVNTWWRVPPQQPRLTSKIGEENV